MSESRPTPTEADLEALRALQAEAYELERIENMLDRFNVFEAIGFVGQEIKHSLIMFGLGYGDRVRAMAITTLRNRYPEGHEVFRDELRDL